MDFEITSYLLIIKSVFVKYLRKMVTQRRKASALLCFKKAYDSISREVSYSQVI